MNMKDKHGFFTRMGHGAHFEDRYLAVTPPIYQTSTFYLKTPNMGQIASLARLMVLSIPGWEIPQSVAWKRLWLLWREFWGNCCGQRHGCGKHHLHGTSFCRQPYCLYRCSIWSLTRGSGKTLFPFWSGSQLRDSADLKQVEAALKPNTKLIYLETPANPTIKISDIAACAELAHSHGIKLVWITFFVRHIYSNP